MDTDKYIGRLLDNRYEIQEVIGIGGMAVVYKARCHRLNRLVAIKILKEDYCQDEDFRRRFHAESQAVAMLSHPNIVSVYDVSTSAEADYIVMELIDGISLKQYMEKKGVLNWKETLHFAIQIGKALEHAHSRGIVHRDIKPHNVMVLKNGSVKVTDFGIARVMSKGNTLTKEALGSVHYISPEQAKGGRVDNRSDIYSLGVVMYEMMTGRPPYDGESPVAVAIQHINGGAVMPSTLNPNIPGGLEQIIMKAMAHEPADRYALAATMLYDMDEFRKSPIMLFDYNTPPIDDVTRLQRKSASLEAEQARKTTAEAVAAQNDSTPRLRRTGQTTGRQSVNRQTTAGKRYSSTGARQSASARRRSREAEDAGNRIATIAVVVCSVVAIIAIAVFLFIFFQDGVTGPHVEYVSVPTYIGKPYESIQTTDGIILQGPTHVHSDKYAKGYVMEQNPLPGEKVVKGTEVSLVVSLGPAPETLTMEDLVGCAKTHAEKYLRNRGFEPMIREENSNEFEEGYVTRTEPAAGEPIEEGQIVTLWVSKGPEVIRKPMPNVVGWSADKALEILTRNGFNNCELEPVDSNEPEGEVVWQSEEKNASVDVTTMITLKVSKGPTEPVTEPTTQPTTAPTTQPTTTPTEPTAAPALTKRDVTWGLLEGAVEEYALKIVNKESGQTLIEQKVTPGTDVIQLQLTGSGVQIYEIWINGIKDREETVDFTNG